MKLIDEKANKFSYAARFTITSTKDLTKVTPKQINEVEEKKLFQR